MSGPGEQPRDEIPADFFARDTEAPSFQSWGRDHYPADEEGMPIPPPPQILARAELGVGRLKTGPMPADEPETTNEVPEVTEEVTDQVRRAVPAVLTTPPPPAPPPPPLTKKRKGPQAIAFSLPSAPDDLELDDPVGHISDEVTEAIPERPTAGIAFSEVLRVAVAPKEFLLNKVGRESLHRWIRLTKEAVANDPRKLAQLRRALVMGRIGRTIADGTVDVEIHGQAIFNV
jgi:hypothetical protein